jgi:hypothetical protein
MKKSICILCFSFGLFSTFLISCKKEQKPTVDCFPNRATYRQIVNKPASIRQLPSGAFYIIEQGAFDTRLNPCNLSKDFQVDNLDVKLSGEVKITVQGGPGPCCTEDFVILKITR